MNKYKLKKDLPFAKAGTEAFVDFENDVYIKEVPTLQCAIHSGKTWLGDIQSLIKLGWIEEVKPREFNICFEKTGIITHIIEDGKVICNNGQSNLGSWKSIIVREVIE